MTLKNDERYMHATQDRALQDAVVAMQDAVSLFRRLGFIAEVAGHHDQCVNAIAMITRLQAAAANVREHIHNDGEAR